MTSKQWQLANDAALRYQEIAVPSILGPFAEALVNHAKLAKAHTVVEVGCGTGAATYFAAERVGASGRVIGTDVNEAMLSVAGSLPSSGGASIEWRQESATALSMEDDSVDAVLCAQALQFVAERQQALSEMCRILKAGQSAYISLWCDVTESPYFDTLLNTIAEHIGEDTATGLRSAFTLSELKDIQTMMDSTQFSHFEISVSELVLKLPPIEEFVPQHIQATPLRAGYNAASATTQQTMLNQMSELLRKYRSDSGVDIPFRTYLIKATK